jgi:uncharacterized membrane protein YqhA
MATALPSHHPIGHKVLEKAGYLALIGVVSLIVASAMAFLWGAVMTVLIAFRLLTHAPAGSEVSAVFISLIDVFLVATGLLIFGLGLEQLFFGELDVPDWLKLHTLHELKVRLSSIIILVLAVAFLDHLVEWKSASETLMFAGATALVSFSLIAFSRLAPNE